MRCHVRVPMQVNGKPSAYADAPCWEPLNDRCECPIHGQQVFVKPDWMSDEQWQNSMRNMCRQTVSLRRSNPDSYDGRTQSVNRTDTE